jgi:hypothetical protein
MSAAPPSRRASLRSSRAGARLAVLAALLAATGCGSSPEAQAQPGTKVTVAPAFSAPDVSGPCDQRHQDAAIAAAAAAIHHARGQVQLDKPDAHFGARYAHPQMPGQPPASPTYGWWVSYAIHDEQPAANATPTQQPWFAGGSGQAPAPVATKFNAPAPGQRELATTPDLEQTALLNQEQMRQGPRGIGPNAQPPKQTTPPPDPATAPGGIGMSGLVRPPQGMPMSKPDPKNAMPMPRPSMRPMQIGVFVAVDGSTTLL